MYNTKLAIHHIGARGPTQAFPLNAAIDASVVNVLYDADPACITEVEQLNCERAAKVIVLNECVSGTGGPRTFCDAHDGYGSSLFEANAEIKNLYMPLHWMDYDYTVYEAVSGKSRRQVDTKTLDQIAAEHSDVPLPDFLSLDTQGSELEILQGAPISLESTVCIVTEVEFQPLYENQPLFGDICAFLESRGFLFARFFQLYSGSFYRAPIGLRGNGFEVTTDALFLRDPRTISNSSRTIEEKAISLAKLSFFAVAQGYLEHGLWALREADRYGLQELDITEPWFTFTLKFFDQACRFPWLMPETFAERHGKHALGKVEITRFAKQRMGELNSCVVEMLKLLQEHHFYVAVEALQRQLAIDLKRLDLPS